MALYRARRFDPGHSCASQADQSGLQDQAGDDRQDMSASHRPGSRARARQVVCLQELFNGPYFLLLNRNRSWYELTERSSGWPDGQTDAASWPRSTRWSWWSRCTRRTCTGVYYNSAAVIDADGSPISASSARSTSPIVPRASGRNSTSGLAIFGYPVFQTRFGQSRACTSVTTATFPEVRSAALASTVRRSSSIPSATVAGLERVSLEDSNNRHTRWPISTSSGPSTDLGYGRTVAHSASSMDRVISAIRADRYSPKRAAMTMRS